MCLQHTIQLWSSNIRSIYYMFCSNRNVMIRHGMPKHSRRQAMYPEYQILLNCVTRRRTHPLPREWVMRNRIFEKKTDFPQSVLLWKELRPKITQVVGKNNENIHVFDIRIVHTRPSKFNKIHLGSERIHACKCMLVRPWVFMCTCTFINECLSAAKVWSIPIFCSDFVKLYRASGGTLSVIVD